MTRKIKRIYVDASAVLGLFDPHEIRRQQTERFWQAVKDGRIIAIISDVLDSELKEDSKDIGL